MRCKLYRRKISAAIDSAAPMSRAVKRHLLQCAECRGFAALTEEAGRRLAGEAKDIVGSTDQALVERIKSSLGSARLQPDPRTGVREARVERRHGARPWLSSRLNPILAAAGALVIIGAGVLFLARQRPQPALTPGLATTFKIEEPGKYLVAAMERVNSPYETEMQLWKQTLDGAARKLESALDIGLGE